MIAAVTTLIEYFRAPTNYFWHWAEKGSVIEWKHGSTICFTNDVTMLMKAVTEVGMPPFGAVLLVLAACNDNWNSSTDCIGILHGLKHAIPKGDTDSDDEVMNYYINQAVKCMDMIALLPKELRKGMKRAHLLHEVFKVSGHAIDNEEIQNAADELNSGRLDEYILNSGVEINREQFKQDLEYLVSIYHTYSYP